MLFKPWILRVYFLTLVVFYKSEFKLESQNMPAQNITPVPELPGAMAGTECETDTYMEVPTDVVSSASKLPYSL